jgi:hypothetical protein
LRNKLGGAGRVKSYQSKLESQIPPILSRGPHFLLANPLNIPGVPYALIVLKHPAQTNIMIHEVFSCWNKGVEELSLTERYKAYPKYPLARYGRNEADTTPPQGPKLQVALSSPRANIPPMKYFPRDLVLGL